MTRKKKCKLDAICMPKERLEVSELEWFRRGAELEELNALITAWKDLLPEIFHAKARVVLDRYIKRNTMTKGTENVKYKKKGKRKK